MQVHKHQINKVIFSLAAIVLFMGNQALWAQQSNKAEETTYVQSWPDARPLAQNLGEIHRQIQAKLPAVRKVSQQKIVIHIMVDENGRYVKHWLPYKIQPELKKALVEVLPGMHFQPAILMDRKVAAWAKVYLEI